MGASGLRVLDEQALDRGSEDGGAGEGSGFVSGRGKMIAKSVLDLVGSTPLIELSRIHPGSGRILAKAEHLNPGGSMKDRAAIQMIRDAETDRQLHPGQTVVEMTSGNMGSGLAIACGATGHPFVAVMSRGNSPARKTLMEALGAQVV